MEADAADGASLQSAFEGAYGVFSMTVTIHGPPTAHEEYDAEVNLGASPASAHVVMVTGSVSLSGGTWFTILEAAITCWRTAFCRLTVRLLRPV